MGFQVALVLGETVVRTELGVMEPRRCELRLQWPLVACLCLLGAACQYPRK